MTDQSVVGVTLPGRRAIAARLRSYGIVLVFIALFIALSLSSDAFLTSRNVFNLLGQNAPIGIVACGSALVIISGGFDLSSGAVYAFSGVVAAKLSLSIDPVVGLAIGVLVGLGLGLVNGLVITLFSINSFIATLATGYVFRGVATLITGGFLVSVSDDAFTYLGSTSIGDMKLSVLIFAVVAVVSGLVLSGTRFGRYLFAVGGNPEAARLSGIRVDLVRTLAFAYAGTCSGLAGILAASRVGTGQADAGTGLELTVIAAVVVGGISILGGEGAIWRAVLGVLLIALIGNGFNILNIDPFYQSIAQGVIILVAVAVDSRTAGPLSRMLRRMRLRYAPHPS